MDNNVKVMASFDNLPEDCISTILSLSSPRDVCRSATACSALRLAAGSDFVWESFLPSGYNEIVSRADEPLLLGNKFGSKKQELFFKLCNSVPIDGGRKIFILERSHGLISYILSARELSIAWGNDPMYWSWKYTPKSRFRETAELRTTSWLEIHGKMKLKSLSPNTAYGAYLIFNVSESRAYGLDTMPMEISVQVGSDPVCRNTVYLRQHDGHKQKIERLVYYNRMEMLKSRVIQGPEGTDPVYPGARDDGWMEIELGQFLSGGDVDDDKEVKMSLMEIKGHHLKGGLLVEGIEIRPLLLD